LRYAVGQIFITYSDSGGRQFNFSEFGGISAAVAISMAYYPENRSASDAISKLGLQIALDAGGNVLKEFWPQGQRRCATKRGGEGAGITKSPRRAVSGNIGKDCTHHPLTGDRCD
jgi:hypothetical protein